MTAQEDDPYRAPASGSDPVPSAAASTGRLFRLLLVAYTALTFAGIVASFLPRGISPRLAEAFENEPPGGLDRWLSPVWLLAFTLCLLVMMLAGMAGMFLFKRWGRRLSLWFTVASFALYPVSGPSLLSGYEQMLWDTAAMVWGGLLALAYCSPVKALFDGTSAR